MLCLFSARRATAVAPYRQCFLTLVHNGGQMLLFVYTRLLSSRLPLVTALLGVGYHSHFCQLDAVRLVWVDIPSFCCCCCCCSSVLFAFVLSLLSSAARSSNSFRADESHTSRLVRRYDCFCPRPFMHESTAFVTVSVCVCV